MSRTFGAFRVWKSEVRALKAIADSFVWIRTTLRGRHPKPPQTLNCLVWGFRRHIGVVGHVLPAIALDDVDGRNHL